MQLLKLLLFVKKLIDRESNDENGNEISQISDRGSKDDIFGEFQMLFSMFL